MEETEKSQEGEPVRTKDNPSQKLRLIDAAIEKMAKSDARILQYWEQIKQKLLDSLSRTPDHPTYAAMIYRAISESKRKGGSSEEEISDFIQKEYKDTNLPAAHSSMLKIHLAKLCKKGEIVCTIENRYIFPVEEDSDSFVKLKKQGKRQKHSRRNIRKHKAKKDDQLQEGMNVVHSRAQNVRYNDQIKDVEDQNRSQETEVTEECPGLIAIGNNQATKEKNEKEEGQEIEENLHIMKAPISEEIKENDKLEIERIEDVSKNIKVSVLETKVLEEHAKVIIVEEKRQAKDQTNEPTSELSERLGDQTMEERHYLEEQPVGGATEEKDKCQNEESEDIGDEVSLREIEVLNGQMGLSRPETNPTHNNTPQFTKKQVESEAAKISLSNSFLASENFKDSIPNITLMKSTYIGVLNRAKEVQQDLENVVDFLSMMDGSTSNYSRPVMEEAATGNMLKTLSASFDVLTDKMQLTQGQQYGPLNLERYLEFIEAYEKFSQKLKKHKQLCDRQMDLLLDQNSIPIALEPDSECKEPQQESRTDNGQKLNSTEPQVRQLQQIEELQQREPEPESEPFTKAIDDLRVPLALLLKQAPCQGRPPKRKVTDMGETFPLNDHNHILVQSYQPKQQRPKYPRGERATKQKVTGMGESLPLNDHNHIHVQLAQAGQQRPQHPRRGRPPKNIYSDLGESVPSNAQNHNEKLTQQKRGKGRPRKPKNI